MDEPGPYESGIALDLRASVLHSLRRALRGQVPGSARAYSFACDPVGKRITLKAEVEHEPSADDRDDIETIESEVYADFMDDWNVVTLIEVVPPGEYLHPLADGIAFSRA